jgi:hypothetical protein
MPQPLPVHLDLDQRRVVVVGFGSVGRRKAEALHATGARIVVVDPVLKNVPDHVEAFAEPYRPEHLQGAALVVAATGLQIDRQVVSDAKALGIWVVCASEPALGNVRMPASSRSTRRSDTLPCSRNSARSSRLVCRTRPDVGPSCAVGRPPTSWTSSSGMGRARPDPAC